MKQTILHINIHGNHSDVGSHHQHKPGCRCWLAPGARRCVTAVWDSRDTHPGWTRCCCRSRGRAVLCWLTLIIKKITFLLGPSHTKRQVFSPPLSLSAPSSFFFFSFSPQPHTIVNTMMAALKHWSGSSEQDRTPPPPCALFWILHWSQLSGCERWRHLHPLPFLDRKQSDSGFFPPFFFAYLGFLISSPTVCFRLKKFPFDVTPLDFFLCALQQLSHVVSFSAQPVEQHAHC